MRGNSTSEILTATTSVFDEELTTNYVAIVSLIKFFAPHFLKLGVRVIYGCYQCPSLTGVMQEQGRPTFIIPISSGLGVLPGFWVPTYSASKAAMHSFSLCLNFQFSGTNVNVSEIIPP